MEASGATASPATELKDGLVYGIGGGLANPATTPPEQLGQYQVGLEGGFGRALCDNSKCPGRYYLGHVEAEHFRFRIKSFVERASR